MRSVFNVADFLTAVTRFDEACVHWPHRLVEVANPLDIGITQHVLRPFSAPFADLDNRMHRFCGKPARSKCLGSGSLSHVKSGDGVPESARKE